jgi:hypothetical protein
MSRSRQDDRGDRAVAAREYCVVEARTVEALEEEVERLLEKGWRVQGGVAILGYAANPFYQAMVR